MGLLEKEEERWRTNAELAPFLIAHGEKSLLPLTRYSLGVWDRW